MDYEAEIGRLKHQLRRQRAAGVALAGLLGVGMIAGGTEPEPPAGHQTPLMARHIFAESLTIVDSQGNKRITIGASDKTEAAAAIKLHDRDGEPVGMWVVNPGPEMDQLLQIGRGGGSVFRVGAKGEHVRAGIYSPESKKP